MSTPYFDIS